jgi:hypothetical protein
MSELLNYALQAMKAYERALFKLAFDIATLSGVCGLVTLRPSF